MDLFAFPVSSVDRFPLRFATVPWDMKTKTDKHTLKLGGRPGRDPSVNKYRPQSALRCELNVTSCGWWPSLQQDVCIEISVVVI